MHPALRRRRILLILLIQRRRRQFAERQSRERAFWTRSIYLNREYLGAFNTLFQELKNGDQKMFFNFTRMSVAMFDYVHSLVRYKLERFHVVRRPIDSEERLAITLRYLASGDSMMSMTYLFRVSAASVSHIIRETCEVLWETLAPLVFEQWSIQLWKRIADEYERKLNFPNCVGAIDGKHIVMQAPPGSGSQYFNYKKTHSIVLLGICDSNSRFTAVDIGAYGRQSDSSVFNNSQIGQEILSNTMPLPPPRVPLTGGPIFPYVFVGDEAFPLKETLMRPYPGGGSGVLPEDKRVFNYRLSRARQTIEGAFGILTARWRILRRTIICQVETVEAITKACVCLHNLLMTEDTAYYCPINFADRDENGVVTPGLWREDPASLRGLARDASRNYSRSARATRDMFSSYFSQEGSVEWQLQAVRRTE